MKVGDAHLTYCTNIHAGESWAEVRANLERHTLAVKRRVCPDAPFGIGLRLGALAVADLPWPGQPAFDAFVEFLTTNGLYVFTINGFPYGPFHGVPVKDAVYRPDWSEPERVEYTSKLAEWLGQLLQHAPAGTTGSISTVPLCFRKRTVDAARLADNLAACADALWHQERVSGKSVVLALEPEPACRLETTVEAVEYLAELLETRRIDRRHLAICLDACHAAVEFEDLAHSLAIARQAGIAIAKVQLSCGLRVSPVDAGARAALAPFAEGTYLHQTVAKRRDALARFDDLPDALSDRWPADEWRIHFHVPIFHADIPPFGTTQPFLAELLAEHKRQPISTHLEVETYTWDVLPPQLRDRPLDEAIATELQWVLDRLR